jgi:hypothetical protein
VPGFDSGSIAAEDDILREFKDEILAQEQAKKTKKVERSKIWLKYEYQLCINVTSAKANEQIPKEGSLTRLTDVLQQKLQLKHH